MGVHLHYDKFRSPDDCLRAAQTRKVNSCWSGRTRESDRRDDWGDVNSFAEAVAKAEEGYKEITEEMKKHYEVSSKYVNERIGVRKVMPVNAYVGSTPNVTRAILGLPRDMRRTDLQKKKLPGVSLVYDCSLHCGYSDDVLKERGARMLTLVSLCAEHNIPVRLSVSDTTSRLRTDDGWTVTEVSVKDYGDIMNIRKVSYWLAHPSVLRRIFFAITETSPVVTRYCSGYGYPISNNRDDCEEVRKIRREEDNTFWFNPNDFKTDDDIISAWNIISGVVEGVA